jgi:hypothetical protein
MCFDCCIKGGQSYEQAPVAEAPQAQSMEMSASQKPSKVQGLVLLVLTVDDPIDSVPQEKDDYYDEKLARPAPKAVVITDDPSETFTCKKCAKIFRNETNSRVHHFCFTSKQAERYKEMYLEREAERELDLD